MITREYPVSWQDGMEPYYPVNDERNQNLYCKYAALAEKEENIIFGGRLGEYKYYDMDKVIAAALEQLDQDCVDVRKRQKKKAKKQKKKDNADTCFSV